MASFRSLAALALAATACGSSPSDPAIGEQGAAIVNGSIDTAHDAVVAVFSGVNKCTGTIVAVVGGDGYVLTAAHCVDDTPPTVVTLGDDYADAPLALSVTDYQIHPDFQHPYFDFVVVKFAGAPAGTPTIPPLAAADDVVSTGDLLDLVGFGDDEGGFNTARRHVVKPLVYAGMLALFYDQADSGMCWGDSGGPSLTTVGGQERVAGVSAAMQNADCTGIAAADRVSVVTDTFIWPVIDGTPIELQTCGQCQQATTGQNGPCNPQWEACLDDPDCDALTDCGAACSTDACWQQCLADHPTGAQVYQAVWDCTCTVSCVDECDAECNPEPGTGGAGGAGTGGEAGGPGSEGGGGGGGEPVTSGAGGADASAGSGVQPSSNDADPGADSGCSVARAGEPSSESWLVAVALVALGLARRRPGVTDSSPT